MKLIAVKDSLISKNFTDMKKIIFAIICFVLCTGYAKAETDKDEKIQQLTEELIAYFGGKLPTGITLSPDSTTSNINLKEFLTDSVSKRYFEQVGQIMLTEKAVENEMKIEIEDMRLEEIPEEIQEVSALQRQQNQGPLKAVAVPQVTFCLSIPYTYMSVDGKNNPVRLSSIMYRPSPFQFNYTAKVGAVKWIFISPIATLVVELVKGLWNATFGYTFDYGVLLCHPTVTTSEEAPTGKNPLGDKLYMFCSNYAIVVYPDYCGYGLSEYRQHPYLVQGITARNVVDGYIAALDLIKENKATGASGSWNLASDFYTDVMGYSQGGSVALATLRYLESDQVSKENLDRINLRNTYCGDGPYSPIATVKQYVEWSNMKEDKYHYMEYPCVLPLIVQAAKDAYNSDCMRTVEIESYFTKKFLDTNILKDLDSKRVPTWQLNRNTTAAGTRSVDEIMSDKIIVKRVDENTGEMVNDFNTESNEYKCLFRALEYNDLSKGWTPHHNLLFMHYDGDGVVPYCNMEEVKRNLTCDSSKKMVFIDAVDVRLKMITHSPAWSLIAELVQKVYANPDHGSMGELFFLAAASGLFDDLVK